MPGTDEPVVDHATAVARALAGLEVDREFWRAALPTWHRTGNWDTAKHGPAPGKPGCCVPVELLPASCVVAQLLIRPRLISVKAREPRIT
jgi:hypothetical protein